MCVELMEQSNRTGKIRQRGTINQRESVNLEQKNSKQY